MTWIELILTTSPEHAPECENWLEQIGAEAITLCDAEDKPVYEPMPGTTPLWPTTQVIGLFPEHTDIRSRFNQLFQGDYNHICTHYSVRKLDDEDWANKWLEYVKPIHIGDDFWITPPILKTQIPSNQAHIVYIEPGLAFGTGSHQTTQLCLQAILSIRDKLHEKQVIDYGCGSGILGLAALHFGAKHVWATDISEQALESTHQNAALNTTLCTALSTVKPSELTEKDSADILLANILANPLIDLVTTFQHLLKRSGYLILSGLLDTDEQRVLNAYYSCFRLIDRLQMDEWICLVFKQN